MGVYKLTLTYPKDERFALVNQMRRSAVSIPAGIAEGFIRVGSKDKGRFYNISRASAEELRYYLFLSKELGYTEGSASIDKLLDEVCAMLHRLREVVLSGSRYPEG
jgi:four helix bundle protein